MEDSCITVRHDYIKITDQKRERWKIVHGKMMELLNSKAIDKKSLAIELKCPQATIRRWVKTSDILPSQQRIAGIELAINNIPNPTVLIKNVVNEVHVASMKRKADIIAREFETILPLLDWFIKNGTVEHRNYLRKLIGIDMSYDMFNATRALLTEKHHKAFTEEK
jgi:hypothetical protein